MSHVDQLKERLPDYARDLRINLGAITGSTALSPTQAWTIAVASACTARDREVIAAIEADAHTVLDAPALEAARGAAAIMAMTNVYYRFVHFMGEDSEYGHLPARLRMQIIGSRDHDKLAFELASLASSAITGCESCVRAHERAIRERGGTQEMIQDAVRIAAVIYGVAATLSAGPS